MSVNDCICDPDKPHPACRAVFHRDAPPIAGEDTKPGKVIAREAVLPKEGTPADAAIKGMVGRLFGAALEEFAEATTLAFTVALRELAEANMAALTKRVLELVETQMKGRA